VWTSARDKWEVADELQTAGVAAAAVENIRDAIERDPQLHRHYQLVRQPSFPDVAIPIQGECIQEPGNHRPVSRAPMYGENTDQVLRDLLGRTDDEIRELRAIGAIA